MTGLDVLLENARYAAELADGARQEAAISYAVLEEVVGPSLDALGRFLVWAAIPDDGEVWICEHGRRHVIEEVQRRPDSTAVVFPLPEDRAGPRLVAYCCTNRRGWHTSAFLPAWRPVR